jgi:hypothetical protein
VQTSGWFVQRLERRVQGIGDRVQGSGRLVQPTGRLVQAVGRRVQPWNRLVHRYLYKTGTFCRLNNPGSEIVRICGSAGGRLQMVVVRKNLDLVWVWFYKDVAPYETATNIYRLSLSYCFCLQFFQSTGHKQNA